MGPVVRIWNRTTKKISFVMEGGVVGLGVCRIRSVEPNDVVKVKQSKIVSYSHRHQSLWGMRVLVDGEFSGLVIEQIHLLRYAWILFFYHTVDDGSVVFKAKGLRSGEKYSTFLLLLRWSFGLRGKRHRECRMLKEMHGLEDIAEAPVKDEGMRSEMEYNSLEYMQPLHFDNMKVAHLSEADMKQGTKLWENAIVGYISAEDIKDCDVKQFVNEQWKNFGSFTIRELKPQFFLFDFRNEADKWKVLYHGHWFVCSIPLILKRWTPNLLLDPKCFVSTLPVWVRFPNLNLEFWSSLSMTKIASVIGKPLFTDEATALRKSLLYARVCIEVNPEAELPKVVPILYDEHGLINQSVEYEWTPRLCRHCHLLWHDSSTCTPHSVSPVLNGNEATPLAADAQTSGSNDIQESSDITSQEITTNAEVQRTTNMALSEDGKKYCLTAKLLGSGRSASSRWLAYGKEKAMTLVGTTNSWIAIVYDNNIPDC